MSSIELLQSSPAAMLTSVVMRKDQHRGASSEPDGSPHNNKRETLRKLNHSRPSSQFLDCGYHYLLYDFPWKRDDLLAEEDADCGLQLSESINPFSPISRRSRMISDGSEDVFEPCDPLADMMIVMEEDSNEEQRRIQANLKWNLRRQKIENEFLRLRHLSINKSRAAGVARLRHSVSFGDDLEIQLEQSGMRDLEKEGDDFDSGSKSAEPPVVIKRDRSLTTWNSSLGGANLNKPYGRSMSMPSKDFEERLGPGFSCVQVPSLETHEEFVEEEEEEEGERRREEEEEEEEEVEGTAGMLGLPPKDVPNLSMDWTETDNEVDNDEID